VIRLGFVCDLLHWGFIDCNVEIVNGGVSSAGSAGQFVTGSQETFSGLDEKK
jgi:hypothetical protein